MTTVVTESTAIVQARAIVEAMPDPEARVLLPDGKEQITWKLSQNRTDRWGELNYHEHETKPLALLEADDALRQRLLDQMFEESTFIVRMDGKYCVLFEAEYTSIESEQDDERPDPSDARELRPQAQVVAALQKGLLALQKRYPGVLFAVPDPEYVYRERPAVWAIVQDGHLTAEQRESLGIALLTL